MHTVDVTYLGDTKPVEVGDAALHPFFERALSAFELPLPSANISSPLPHVARSSSSLSSTPSSDDLAKRYVPSLHRRASTLQMSARLWTSSEEDLRGTSVPSESKILNGSSLPSCLSEKTDFEGTADSYNSLSNDFECPLTLAFKTSDGTATAAVTSDFALRLSLNTSSTTGCLALVSVADLPSVDTCMQTILRAVVDTATRRDAAAVFLALSGAWDHACREARDSCHIHSTCQPQCQPQQAYRNQDDSIAPPDLANSNTINPQPHTQSRTPSPPCPYPHQCHQHGHIFRETLISAAVEAGIREPSSACSIADAAIARRFESDDSYCINAANDFTPPCFSEHIGVRCSHCFVEPIIGTRYRSCGHLNKRVGSNTDGTSDATQTAVLSSRNGDPIVNLCERCRRLLRERDEGANYTTESDESSWSHSDSFVVYDYPWEASEEYAHACDPEYTGSENSVSRTTANVDALQTPVPPLRLGDVGPRVLHLQFVLYKTGYLSMDCGGRAGGAGHSGIGEWLKPGEYCAGTREVVGKVQRDWASDVAGQVIAGVYDSFTRSILINLLDKADARTGAANSVVRCSALPGADEPRLRMALTA